MGVTISTHNGSAVAREHNIRNPKVTGKEGHINPNGIHETWIDEKPQAAYERLFGAAVEKYNDKQKRSDRKITDYYRQICGDKKKHAVYEMIIAVGDRTDYSSGNLDEKTAKSILREFVDGWQERNPHLVLIGAYYHADEQGAPHAHLDYIPVANGYKRGLETQSALVKALEQQGFSKDGKETAQIQWERRENAHLESLCESRSIEVIHPRIADRQHLDTSLYQLEQEVKATEHHIEACRSDNLGLELRQDKLRKEKDELELVVGQLREYHETLKSDISTTTEQARKADKRLAEVRQALNRERVLDDKIREYEQAKTAYQAATSDFEQKFSQAVAAEVKSVLDRTKDLLYYLADFCSRLQMVRNGEKVSVWQAFIHSQSHPHTIDFTQEMFGVSAKLAKEHTPQNDKNRTNSNQKHH